MAATLNRRAYEHAINNGRFVFDERDVWSEHRPSAQKKTTSFASTALPNTASGIWESTTKSPQPKRHQAEQQTQKQTCHQREIERHVSPLDRDVSGSRPNPIWL
jgi:hypothetical protein